MEKQIISLIKISIQVRSKKEIYSMLQLEADVYLPLIPQTNRKYIVEIISGKRKVSRFKIIEIVLKRQPGQVSPSSTLRRLTNDQHSCVRKTKERHRPLLV